MKELEENIKLFWKSAEAVFKLADYTSATILYFKCFFAVLDLIIFRKLATTPKDHSERFRILQKDFSDSYLILDMLFQVYRDTYSIRIEKVKCEEVRENVFRIAKKQRIQLFD